MRRRGPSPTTPPDVLWLSKQALADLGNLRQVCDIAYVPLREGVALDLELYGKD